VKQPDDGAHKEQAMWTDQEVATILLAAELWQKHPRNIASTRWAFAARYWRRAVDRGEEANLAHMELVAASFALIRATAEPEPFE
jgi:hypothetical protein